MVKVQVTKKVYYAIKKEAEELGTDKNSLFNALLRQALSPEPCCVFVPVKGGQKLLFPKHQKLGFKAGDVVEILKKGKHIVLIKKEVRKNAKATKN